MTALFHSGQPILLGLVGLYALYAAVRDTRSGVAGGGSLDELAKDHAT
jgi:hypothetical protein